MYRMVQTVMYALVYKIVRLPGKIWEGSVVLAFCPITYANAHHCMQDVGIWCTSLHVCPRLVLHWVTSPDSVLSSHICSYITSSSMNICNTENA